MKIAVDLTKCQGYANCVIEASDLFDLDDETNQAVVLSEHVPAGREDDARRAEASCPVRAIALRE